MKTNVVYCQVWADSVGPGAPPQLWAEAAADPPGSEWGVCQTVWTARAGVSHIPSHDGMLHTDQLILFN